MMLGFRTIYGLGFCNSLHSHLPEIISQGGTNFFVFPYSSNGYGTWDWDMIGRYFPSEI